MINLRGQFIGLLAAIGLVCMDGCTLDEPPSSSSDPALTLTSTQNLSLTVLNWDKVKVTGFKEYIILQSSDPIPNSPTPVVNQDVTVLKRIKDVDENTFSVSAILFTPQVCYKVYCAVDDRFLYSSTLCVDQQIEVVDGFYDRACHTTGIDEVVMFDRVNKILASCNYKSGIITNAVADVLLSFPSLELSTWENTTHTFAFDQSPAWLRKYTYPQLTASNTKNYSQILWTANVHNQFVFVGSDEFNSSFQVLNRNNLNILDAKPGLTGNQTIAVFPGDPVTVLTIGSSEAIKYTVNTLGKVTSTENVSARILQPDLQYTCAEGTELFICGREGAVINRNGEHTATLNTDINSFIMLTRLSPDEKKAVYVINENGLLRLVVEDISQLPVVTTIQSFDLPALNYADIIPEEDIIYVIGTTFTSSQGQTFILKYPI